MSEIKSNIDVITLRVIESFLLSVAEEMGIKMTKAAYSTNIRDRKDCSCAILDSSGHLLAVGEHVPAHLGPMGAVGKAIFSEYKSNEIKQGDIYMCNDSYMQGGSHLMDIKIIFPIFYQRDLAFFAVTAGHHSDIGGANPGSLNPNVTSIFQEGIRIPLVKLYAHGRRNNELLKMLLQNSRLPDERYGDIMSQVGAVKAAEERLLELTSKYGLGTIKQYSIAILNHTETLTRAMIQAVSDGIFQGEDYLEGDGIEDRLIKISIAVKIHKDTLHVDFSGTDAQTRGPFNMPADQTKGTIYHLVKCLLGAEGSFNAGLFKPITFNLPEGSLINPYEPSPTGMCTSEVPSRISDAFLKAMAQSGLSSVTSGWGGTRNIFFFSGLRSETKEPFVMLETYASGQGGRGGLNKDGLSAVPPYQSNSGNMSTEVLELEYPITSLGFELIRGSEGAGKYRGGLGVRRSLKILDCEAGMVSFTGDRRKFAPHGLYGGKPGRSGYQRLFRTDKERKMASKSSFEVKPEDIFILDSPGGGGYGPPWERDLELVLQDVKEGLITKERATSEYGVIILQDMMIDEKATSELRCDMKKQMVGE